MNIAFNSVQRGSRFRVDGVAHVFEVKWARTGRLLLLMLLCCHEVEWHFYSREVVSVFVRYRVYLVTMVQSVALMIGGLDYSKWGCMFVVTSLSLFLG